MNPASESREAHIAETAQLLKQGLNTQQVAAQLGVHYSTANDYVKASDKAIIAKPSTHVSGTSTGRSSINWTRDEIILACALTASNNWSGLDDKDSRVLALSILLNQSPVHPVKLRDAKFRNPAGVARKTWDIATQHPDYKGQKTKGNKLDAIVLKDFLREPAKMQKLAEAIDAEIRRGDASVPSEGDPDVEDLGVAEGGLLLARHFKRERNRTLRNKKIESVKKAGLPVACEVCTFNFQTTYGPRGQDYIDVHHVLPLHASGPTTTYLKDLALLCANCHRMIHRGNPWLTPDELRELLTSVASQSFHGTRISTGSRFATDDQ